MVILSFIICFFLFIIFGLSSKIVINKIIDGKIFKVLKNYHFTVISLVDSNKTFNYDKEQGKAWWRNFLIIKNSTPRSTTFKEVKFKTIDNKIVISLVAIETTLFIFNKVFFEVDLEKA